MSEGNGGTSPGWTPERGGFPTLVLHVELLWALISLANKKTVSTDIKSIVNKNIILPIRKSYK